MTAIVVARWLIVALPRELADALDHCAASLGPETTPAEAARRVLQAVLLGRTPPCTPAVSPTGDTPTDTSARDAGNMTGTPQGASASSSETPL
jgi:hypothetical protein